MSDEQLLQFAKNYRCTHPGCAPWLDMTEVHFVNVARAIEQASRRAALEEALEPIKLAIGMLALHGHEADGKKVAAEWRALAASDSDGGKDD